MKKAAFLFLWGIFPILASAQTTADDPGNDFSLEAALDLFKNSKSLEAYEKSLNSEDQHINNLDLNNDGETDYLSVEEIADGNDRAIVISAWLADGKKQDVAVIGIEKTGAETAQLQIQGDEDLYAENGTFEPADETTKAQAGKGGPSSFEIDAVPIIVNVWAWPIVRVIYAPGYVVRRSPYRWRAYPGWWRPWRPVTHVVYVRRVAPRVVHYRPAPVRVVAARRVYAPRRSATVVVRRPHTTTVVRTRRPAAKVARSAKAAKTTRAVRKSNNRSRAVRGR